MQYLLVYRTVRRMNGFLCSLSRIDKTAVVAIAAYSAQCDKQCAYFTQTQATD